MKSNIIHIALCTDENYSYPCGVCITSILENNKDKECNIYVLTSGLKDCSIKKFKEISKKYNQRIEIIKIDNHLISGLKTNDRFPFSIYYRFLLPQLLVDLDRVLYLDCDIIVTRNLNELWNTDIKEYACGVIEDQMSDCITMHNRISKYRDYFNSGVLLMNLDYWRRNEISSELINFIYENPSMCLYPDQDALNYVLGDKVLFLKYEYNYQELFYRPKGNLYLHKTKWGGLLPEGSVPTVIHYTAEIKPWHKGCSHPYRSLFLMYKMKSPWKKSKLKSKYRLIDKLIMIVRYAIYTLRR